MRLSVDRAELLRDIEALSSDWYNVPRASRSALGSTGYETRSLLRRAHRLLAKINPHTPVLSLAMQRSRAPRNRNAGGWVYKYQGRGKNRKRLKHFERVGSAHRGAGGGIDTPPFRRAINALRYKVEGDEFVRIGFYRGATGRIDFRLAELIARQADAKDIPITRKMRRFLFAAGMPVKAGTTLHRPARDLLRKTFEENEERLRAHFNVQFWAAMERYRGGKK